jgi:RNA polymerase sigma-70 factor (ECF subfamily)
VELVTTGRAAATAPAVATSPPSGPSSPASSEGSSSLPASSLVELRLRRNDAAGDFEAFYRANADKVRRALAVTLGDAHVAAEATDEAMTRALARWRRVSTHDSPAGWVYRVGLNWAISRWRRLRREAPLDDRETDRSRTGSRGERPRGPGRTGWSTRSDAVETTVEPPDPVAAAAGDALRELPLDQRAVVVCRVLLECSTGETAALLDIPVGTVKSRLARGLAHLRRTLDDTPTAKLGPEPPTGVGDGPGLVHPTESAEPQEDQR